MQRKHQGILLKNAKKPGINPENTTLRKVEIVCGLTFGTEPIKRGMILDASLDTLHVYFGVRHWKWASKRCRDALLANTMAQLKNEQVSFRQLL